MANEITRREFFEMLPGIGMMFGNAGNPGDLELRLNSLSQTVSMHTENITDLQHDVWLIKTMLSDKTYPFGEFMPPEGGKV